ncbi:hypothetical protein CALCODRAFT_512268 [Calocera cornea HHB12733]|uniref:Uncharacterized protein n=1 Tax=Calocera cornea HHB12733 TaxID=1353952 RepID=A0A165D590_9BASI|nr:hypothetical protein CALCODRAFT_512268 [Calocera cornea HHB12733]
MAAQEGQEPAPASDVGSGTGSTLSRNQLKKQKKAQATKPAPPPAANGIHDPVSAALTDHAPGKTEIAQGKVDASLLAGKGELGEAIAEDGAATLPEGGPKFATVEFVSKRIRNFRKKIDRILTYAHKPRNELNEDQKKLVDSLPGLQGAMKELEEVRKGLELIEIEQTVARDTLRQLEQADASAAIASAVQAAQAAQEDSFKLVLGFMRFYQALMLGTTSCAG